MSEIIPPKLKLPNDCETAKGNPINAKTVAQFLVVQVYDYQGLRITCMFKMKQLENNFA